MCEIDKHRLEFDGEKDGLRHWKCLDCGETIIEYHDLGSGG